MKVGILTPVYDGRTHVAHSRAVFALIAALKERGDEGEYITAGSCPILHNLRNGLAAQALSMGCDVLLWVDSDVGFDVNDALRLIDTGLPVVGIAPQKRPLRHGEPAQVAFGLLDNGTIAQRPDGLWNVGLAATAFLVTRREVYEALATSGMAPRLRSVILPPACAEEYRLYFFYDLVESDGVFDEAGGEDYYFCRRAVKAGFDIVIDPSARIIHHEGRTKLTASAMDVHGSKMRVANGDES